MSFPDSMLINSEIVPEKFWYEFVVEPIPNFPKLYRGLYRDGFECIIKTMPTCRPILKCLIGHSSDRIVKIYGILPSSSKLDGLGGMVLESIPGVPASELPIDTSCSTLEDLLLDTLIGVQHLHNLGVAHRDLKPANLMVVQGRIKIIDLDYAVTSATIDRRHQVMGTPYFMSPEIITTRKSQFPIPMCRLFSGDIWSVGITFYTLYYHDYPYTELTIDDFRKRLDGPVSFPILASGTHESQRLRSWITTMLTSESYRPNVSEMIEVITEIQSSWKPYDSTS